MDSLQKQCIRVYIASASSPCKRKINGISPQFDDSISDHLEDLRRQDAMSKRLQRARALHVVIHRVEKLEKQHAQRVHVTLWRGGSPSRQQLLGRSVQRFLRRVHSQGARHCHLNECPRRSVGTVAMLAAWVCCNETASAGLKVIGRVASKPSLSMIH